MNVTKFCKNVARLLVITLLVTMAPINAIKVSATDEEDSITTKSTEDAKIVRELEEKREESTKYFLKDDGTYEAVLYEDPVHYLNNGQWVDIDNSLEDKGNYYESKKNDFTVNIGKNANDKELISVVKDKYKVCWNIGIGSGEKLEKKPTTEDKPSEESEKPSTEDKKDEESEKPSTEDKKDGEIDNTSKDDKTKDETEKPTTDDKNSGEIEKPTTDEDANGEIDKSNSETNNQTTNVKENESKEKININNKVNKRSKNLIIANTVNNEKVKAEEKAEEKVEENKINEEKKDLNINVEENNQNNSSKTTNEDVKADTNSSKDEKLVDNAEKNIEKLKNISKLSKATVENTDINKVIDEMVEKEFGNNRRVKRAANNDKSLRDKIKDKIEKKFLPNIKSKVEFKSIYKDIDLEYKLVGKTVKEDIILNKKIDNPIILFNLNIENLKPKVEGNIIIFEDIETGAEIFTIDKPFMYDAKGEISEDIELIFKEAEEGGYTLEVVPNNEWINDDKREFPITIDPIVKTSVDTNNIEDTFVASTDTENKWNNFFLRVGNVQTIGTTETYLKFNGLPALNAGDMVVSAQLALFKQDDYSGADGQINAYTVTSPWAAKSNGAIWSNKPGVENRILDTQTVNNSRYTWNVTKAVKGWYTEGNNYGIALKRDNPSSGNTAFLSSDCHSAYSAGWPLISIQYVNNTGIESHWTYHSQDMGRAGIGYINDYNGNVVFTHSDYTASDSRLALKIEHIYNSNDKNIDIGYGKGWKLNIHQRITEEVIDGTTYYKYLDSDGTNHYFYFDSASKTYKCESLEGIKFAKNSDGSYDITDKDKNKLYFVPGGYLKTITDTNNNTNTILYDGVTISGVQDSLGRITTLQYTSGGTLIGITDPAGRTTRYAYNGIQLDTITYPDGKASYYTYESNNNLSSVKSLDGAKLLYTYHGGSTSRAKTATYVDPAGVKGQSLSFKYSYNETEIKDVKGRSNTYQFNNLGSTVSIKDSNGSAQYYKYNSNKETRNRLELESKVQKTSRNYLKNHGCEVKGGDWNADYWTGSTGTSEFTTTKANMGSYSLKVAATNTASSRFYNQTITLEKGKTYTFSAHVATEGVSKSNGKGATLFVNYQNATGEYPTIESKYISGTTEWNRESVTFTLPADSPSNDVYIRCGVTEETGTAYFDNLQLEEGPVPNRYNIVENSELGINNLSTEGWTYNDSGTGNAVNYEGRTTYQIKGGKGKNRCLYRPVSVNGKKGDTFVLSGWAKAQALPEKDGRYFALDLGIKLNDGTTQWEVVKFNEGSEGWQYTSGEIVTKGDYSSVEVYCLYYDNENYAYFDNVQLYKEEFGASYQYDSKGNIISTKDLAKQQSDFKYDGEDKLTEVKDPKGNITKYEYDNNRNLNKMTTSENVVSSFTYDSYGNAIASKTSGSGLFMESSSISSDTGGYTKRTIDTSGNEILNVYSESKDSLDVTINPDGVSTYYGYDETDKLVNTTGYKQYGNPMKAETFLINGNSGGDLGSKPLRDSNNFIKDGSGHYTFKAQDGKAPLYNLGLSKNKGTISMKFKPYGSGTTRYILHTTSTNGGLLALYLNGSNKLCLAVRDSSTNWKEVITSTKSITQNNLYATTVQWENTKAGLKATLAVDDEVKSNTFTGGLLDFSGGFTTVGASQSNEDSLNGEIEELRCSSELEDIAKLKAHYNKVKTRSYGYYEDWDEYLPLRGNTSGINGLKAIKDKGKYDSANDLTMQVTEGRYAAYNTGLRDSSGTINLWFNPANGTDVRYVFSGTNKNNALITSYLTADNKLKLAIRDGSTNWMEILSSTTPIATNQWHMLTVSWSKSNNSLIFNMYFNGAKQSKTISNYMDFSGSTITMGQHPSGYSIQGGLDELILSSKCYDDNTVKSMYTKGRGKAVDKVGQNDYTYNNDRLSKVSSNSSSYNFVYDGNGNQKSVAIGNSTLITNNYDNISGVLKNATYGNGNTVAYTYDDLNRVTSKTLDGKLSSKYTYNNAGNLAILQDSRSGITNKYTYDLADRLVKTEDSNGNWFKNDYDKTDKTSKKENYIGGKLYSTSFEFDKDGKTTKVALPSGKSLGYSYDTIGRTKSKTLDLGNSKTFNTQYGYKEGYAGSATSMVSSIKNGSSEIKYTYDNSGRIETVDNGKVIKYYYDSLGQVVREDNGELNKTIVYTYDQGGNILKVTEYELATTPQLGASTKAVDYSYGDSTWKDKLTSYNGKAITYDAIGNPLTYDGYTFKWEGGRTLTSITGNSKNISYKYNNDGIRTEKTVDGVNYKYILEGNSVVHEEINNGSTVDKLVYNYGDSGLVGFMLNGTEYFYIRNTQSDIIGILDSNGTQVVGYTYDTWGKLVSITGTLKDTVGEKNPYRYRGYRYDTETGYYYLQSRYYNPEMGRFINIDALGGDVGALLSHNVFAYCNNNPVTAKDPSGFRPIYTTGEETDAMREASYNAMSKAKAKGPSQKLPMSGEKPNSKASTPDGKTVREYDEHGNAKKDTHYGHPDHHPELKSPHFHDWKWDGNIPHKDGDPYDIVRGVCGVGLVVVCAIGITIIAADDTLGIGVADDFLVAPLGSGVGKGMTMIFGG
jgi:RHS repeat-associated protein